MVSLTDAIAGLQDSFKESFEVLKRFLLQTELTVISLGFVILFVVFIFVFFLVLSSPAFLYGLYMKQKQSIKEFLKNNKNPRDWIGKS